MDKTDAKTAMEELSMILIYLSHFTEETDWQIQIINMHGKVMILIS